MASFPVGKDHYARPLLADDTRDLEPVLPRVLNATVGNIERLPPADFQDLCRGFGFASAVLSAPSRAELALGEIEDPGRVTQARHFEQGAAAGLLHVVAVRGNGKNVYAHRSSVHLCVSASLW